MDNDNLKKDLDKSIKNTVILQQALAKNIKNANDNNGELHDIIESLADKHIEFLQKILKHTVDTNTKAAQEVLTPIKNTLNQEIEKLQEANKTVYYKPYIISIIFVIFSCLSIYLFGSWYLKSLAEQRLANANEIAFIEQSKLRTVYSTCGEQRKLCAKIVPREFYGTNNEYAVLGR
jgi:hypothetical protein